MDVSQSRALSEAVAKVRSRIVEIRARGESIGEQDTKAILIEPVLAALGWRLDELDEVRREYKRKTQDNPVDYALFVLRKPRLFIEAKSLDTSLDHRKCARQVLGYASVVGVGWCVVTNGEEYRLYNSHAAVDVEDKLFRSVRLSDESQTDYALETLGLLDKDTLGENLLETLWKSQFVDRRVKAALEDVFLGEDPGLTRIIRKRLPELAPGEIRDSLRRATVRVEFPVLNTASATRSRQIAEQTHAPSDEGEKKSTRSPVMVGVTISDLIAAGLISPPLRLERTYKGVQLEATIEQDGKVRFEQSTYDSLSMAGGMARKSVVGAPEGRDYPQTNGWTFWQYRNAETGTLHPIDELRQQYLEQRG